MSLTRRTFLKSTTYAGAALVVAEAIKPGFALTGEAAASLTPYLSGMRMAATPASAYRAYRSKAVGNPATSTWVQVDLGSSIPIDMIQLFPASERMYPGRDQYYPGEGFPRRFRIQTCRDPRIDHPVYVTEASTWKRIPYKAEAPRTGVTLEGGLFETALKNNARYLLNSYTTDDLLRQFYERTGKVKDFKPKGSQIFWEEDLAGSNAGRYLMGAGDTGRWISGPAVLRRLNAVVHRIEAC